MADNFDQNAYWVDRHANYRDDRRSVGNMGKSVEENLIGAKRFIAATAYAADDLKPYRTVLDVGCGYGRAAPCFCNSGYAYTGIDVAPAAIESAQNNEPRGHYILGSALDIDFEEKFDLICVLYVFVHFVDDNDWQALIERTSGLVADGGALLVADDFPETEQSPAEHVCQRSLAQYDLALKSAGLNRDISFRERFANSWRLEGSVPPFELFRAGMPD